MATLSYTTALGGGRLARGWPAAPDGRFVFTDSGIPSASAYDARMSASRRKDTDFDRDAAAYTLAEAARYVRLPAATLRSWVLGRQYPKADGRGDFPPLIRP